MSGLTKAHPSAILWQGFTHKWKYNHRYKRFGSFVDHKPENGKLKAHVIHIGASGWGPDEADVRDYYTRITNAADVWFQAGSEEITLGIQPICEELIDRPIGPINLDHVLQEGDPVAVVLNGFDLEATGEFTDKLMSFKLDISDAQRSSDGKSIKFSIKCSTKFDCRSLECWSDVVSKALKSPKPFFEAFEDYAEKIDAAAALEAAEIGVNLGEWSELLDGERTSTGELLERLNEEYEAHEIEKTEFEKSLESKIRELDEVELDEARRSLIREILESILVASRLAKFLGKLGLFKGKAHIPTQYTLRIYYLVVGGKKDSLKVYKDFKMAPCPLRYEWSLNKVNKKKKCTGKFSDYAKAFEHDVPAYKGFDLKLYLHPYKKTPPNQGDCQAMHFTEWNAAIRPEPDSENGNVKLKLLYRTWGPGMEKANLPWSWWAHRFSGHAELEIDAIMLQFDAEKVERPKPEVPRKIEWGGIIESPDEHDPEAKPPIEIEL